MKNKSGFTLVEILVIVLIIGVLTAIALPAYKKSAEKSKVTAAINTMSVVAKSQHTWYLDHNNYTNKFDNLSIELLDKAGKKAKNSEFEDINYKYKLVDAGIMAERNNKEYFIYKDYATNKIICSPGTHYICKDLGAFTKTSCENIDMAWANSNSTCYVDEETKCNDLYPGQELWKDTYCGYTNTNRKELNDGMVCKVTSRGGCGDPIINSGAVCEATTQFGCAFSGSISERGTKDYGIIKNGGVCISGPSGGCNNLTIENGGICESNSPGGGCIGVLVKEGGECWADKSAGCGCCSCNSGVCTATYEGTGATSGCCRGKYCPKSAPRCECPNHEKMNSSGQCIS